MSEAPEYFYEGRSIPLDLIDLFNSYLSKYRNAGIPKHKYQHHLQSLLKDMAKVSGNEKRKMLHSQCRAFLKENGGG